MVGKGDKGDLCSTMYLYVAGCLVGGNPFEWRNNVVVVTAGVVTDTRVGLGLGSGVGVGVGSGVGVGLGLGLSSLLSSMIGIKIGIKVGRLLEISSAQACKPGQQSDGCD